ncbi:GIY-YIG nuclease family protein [Polaribacter sp. WD7]
MKKSFVYILTNTYRTIFYIGVTTNLSKKLYKH